MLRADSLGAAKLCPVSGAAFPQNSFVQRMFDAPAGAIMETPATIPS
jgi:hypothetical protein